MVAISAEKKKLRTEVLERRRSMAPAAVMAESAVIAGHLFAWSGYIGARVVMAYTALPDEVQTDLILRQVLRQGKTLCIPLPGQARGYMEAVRLEELADLTAGKYGILTLPPDKVRLIAPEEIDVIVVPGVAFDRSGQRLGMGAGFYDRFFTRAPQATAIGLALECQVVPVVPSERHDHPVEFLITKTGIINCKTGKM